MKQALSLDSPVDFSVVIPFRDALPEFRCCLNAIVHEARRQGSTEIIAVNNGSADGSAEILKEHPEVRPLRLTNASIAAVRNHGAAHSSGRYLYFLDADCVVSPGHLAAALRVIGEVQCAAVGSRVGVAPNANWVERTWVRLHRPPRDGLVSYINSGNLFVRASVFNQVGGFKEELVTGEDAELGMRLRHYGYCLFQAQSLTVAHLRNPKTLFGFFKKEIWHALGMFGTARGLLLDRPTIMLIVHILFGIGGLAVFLLPNLNFSSRLLALGGAALIVPVTTVGYRMLRHRTLVNPLAATVLYWIYYLGRAVALGLLASRRLTK